MREQVGDCPHRDEAQIRNRCDPYLPRSGVSVRPTQAEADRTDREDPAMGEREPTEKHSDRPICVAAGCQ
jgi:hypothetical protein